MHKDAAKLLQYSGNIDSKKLPISEWIHVAYTIFSTHLSQHNVRHCAIQYLAMTFHIFEQLFCNVHLDKMFTLQNIYDKLYISLLYEEQ